MNEPSTIVVVQVRPKGAGPWHWPHSVATGGYISIQLGQDGVTRLVELPPNVVWFDWATVQAEKDVDGVVVGACGHSIGLSMADAVRWSDVGDIINSWFEMHDSEHWLWEFRLVTA